MAHKARRFYYGWTVVVVVGLVMFAGGSEMNPVLGVFQGPMTEEFGWSRALYAAPMTVGTILGGLIALWMGPALDRYGGRWIMSSTVFILGATFMLMGQIDHLWQHFILQIIGRGALTATVFLAVPVIIPKWFVAKRGRAVAFANLGQRSGQLSMLIIAERMTSLVSWRAAWMTMGATVWAVALIPVLLFLRRRPEDMGLRPDGTSSAQALADEARLRHEEPSLTRRDALRTSAFYLIGSYVALHSFVMTAVNFHWFNYLTDQGISSGVAATTIIVSPLVSIPISVSVGFIVERLNVRILMVTSATTLIVALMVFLATDSAQMAYLFGGILGLAQGIGVTANAVVWGDFFGRANVGGVRSMITPFHMFANSMGPLVAAFSFDTTGSYRLVFTVAAVMIGIGALLLVLARPPKRRTTEPSEPAAAS